ncbi:hypothetical protein A0H81_09460 [Grifola frondosa]|uniref:Uncharacterized protein n=1 Tax=Grifola frondosa TaxID=5627 RepID=A0A1C7M2C5_GRIFR|nr:hypothetical protein A0H81_09460 [Grifola frondosa]
MTLTDARSHPWLAQQARIHGLPPRDRRTASPVPAGPPVVDASMRSIAPDDMAVEDEDAHMDDVDASPRSGVSTPPNIPGSYPLGQNGDPDGVVREASRLLRRSDVVAASQETA